MKDKLKVGILTQPLHDNYGGILQAYALKEVIKDLGHEVVIINRDIAPKKKWHIFASAVKSALKNRRLLRMQKLSAIQKSIVSMHTKAFINKYIPERTSLITSNKEMKRLNNDGFNAYVVGSDQCWRPLYSPEIKNYFLDFAENQTNIKRIAYAASFGTSDWEFTSRQTKQCRKLAKKFNAISVREKSGVHLVEKFLGRCDAVHVLDPTMLLDKHCYEKIVMEEQVSYSPGNLNVYILDKTKEKIAFINNIESQLNLVQFEVMPKKRMQDSIVTDTNAREFQYPNPAQWLKGFLDAKFVITDSFHGTVFSILFNVPFIAIGNDSRGMARFESLLEVFGLSDRLVIDIKNTDLENFLSKKINWEYVNKVLREERVKAFGFLTKSLS